MSSAISNERPQPDQVLVDIVDYVLNYKIEEKVAWNTAFYCFLDTIGCGLVEPNQYYAWSKTIEN